MRLFKDLDSYVTQGAGLTRPLTATKRLSFVPAEKKEFYKAELHKVILAKDWPVVLSFQESIEQKASLTSINLHETTNSNSRMEVFFSNDEMMNSRKRSEARRSLLKVPSRQGNTNCTGVREKLQNAQAISSHPSSTSGSSQEIQAIKQNNTRRLSMVAANFLSKQLQKKLQTAGSEDLLTEKALGLDMSRRKSVTSKLFQHIMTSFAPPENTIIPVVTEQKVIENGCEELLPKRSVEKSPSRSSVDKQAIIQRWRLSNSATLLVLRLTLIYKESAEKIRMLAWAPSPAELGFSEQLKSMLPTPLDPNLSEKVSLFKVR